PPGLYTLSLHDALPIWEVPARRAGWHTDERSVAGDHGPSLLEERHAAAHVDEALEEAVRAPRDDADGGGRDAHDVAVGDGDVGRSALADRFEVDGEGALLARAERPLHGGVVAIGGEHIPAGRRDRSAQREPAGDGVRAGFLDPAVDEHAAGGRDRDDVARAHARVYPLAVVHGR